MSHLLSKDEMLKLMSEKLPKGFPSSPEPTTVADKRHGFLAGDPMSPYRIQGTVARYNNITEVMNKKGFHAWYPQSYTPISKYFLDSGIPPFFVAGEGEDYAKGSLSVANMVELHHMNMPFRLCNEDDIDPVLAIAYRYHDSMSSKYVVPKVKAYVQWVYDFIQRAEDARTATYKRKGLINPHTLDIGKVLSQFLV